MSHDEPASVIALIQPDQNVDTRHAGIMRFSIWWEKVIQNQYLAVNKH
ncbi:hypothetical protein GGQ67_001968 [Rhizobium metallidurans]|uniref:Uncharacterized protein n=1 Tax=Rhizobium metallidurans TaxID=1265931 RepID=A0A7W6CXK4_9HYPH|nr:hypothetical protein [Rhizobium metallidurans]